MLQHDYLSRRIFPASIYSILAGSPSSLFFDIMALMFFITFNTPQATYIACFCSGQHITHFCIDADIFITLITGQKAFMHEAPRFGRHPCNLLALPTFTPVREYSIKVGAQRCTTREIAPMHVRGCHANFFSICSILSVRSDSEW